MKKTNNKFRNNGANNNSNNNSIYSLNYKFDSISIAGKFNATALDLIKRYNELAKEAQSRGDYVDMEVFRQYAEHYRKIVTEINARKAQNRENNSQNQNMQNEETSTQENTVENPTEPVNNGLVETEAAPREEVTLQEKEETHQKRQRKRGFTVIEVSETDEKPQDEANENVKPEKEVKKRRITRKSAVTETDKVQGE